MLRTLASAVALIALASCSTPGAEQTTQVAEAASLPARIRARRSTPERCAACHNNPEATKAPPRRHWPDEPSITTC